MLTCPNPTCKKGLPRLENQCPHCRTDLTLLVDFIAHLQDGLARAESLTREGELGEAVWAYLEVLEVDPDNPKARHQVGQVATAIRQFDELTPSRRWLDRLRRQARFREWLEGGSPLGCLGLGLAILLALGALGFGYWWGFQAAQRQPPPAASPMETMESP